MENACPVTPCCEFTLCDSRGGFLLEQEHATKQCENHGLLCLICFFPLSEGFLHEVSLPAVGATVQWGMRLAQLGGL